MNKENRPLVTNELVEVQDYGQMNRPFWENMWNIPQISKRETEISQRVTGWTWKH